jgi:hypothetical protein
LIYGGPKAFIDLREASFNEAENIVEAGYILHPSLSLHLLRTRAGQIAGAGFFLGFFASLFFLC